jgi:molybdate transport system substrate-binding protein
MALFGSACSRERPAAAPLVLAAASLQESLNAAADAWAAQGHARPVLSFAASSALARQIESGASADLFISADEEWMDTVERSGRIRGGTRADLVANSLVLVEPADADDDTVALVGISAALGDGRLAMADPEAVPAGRYGKAALEQLGQWDAIADRVAPAENVRAALAMVERGQAPLGIVYATDARASRRVRTVATFPASSHPPILYAGAVLTTSSSPDAQPFLAFLRSPEGQAIFARYGFRAPSAQ